MPQFHGGGMSSAANQPPGEAQVQTSTPVPSSEPAIGEKQGQQPAEVRSSQIWLRRLAAVLFVFVCAVLGVILLVFPWTTQWTDNAIFLGRPALSGILNHGFTRGVVTGLGILDIWIGFSTALHYREDW
jgi:hypothetical protein